eukprot:763317-Hanusia_phi.AAC.2
MLRGFTDIGVLGLECHESTHHPLGTGHSSVRGRRHPEPNRHAKPGSVIFQSVLDELVLIFSYPDLLSSLSVGTGQQNLARATSGKAVSLCIIAKACLDEERPPDECFGPTDGMQAAVLASLANDIVLGSCGRVLCGRLWRWNEHYRAQAVRKWHRGKVDPSGECHGNDGVGSQPKIHALGKPQHGIVCSGPKAAPTGHNQWRTSRRNGELPLGMGRSDSYAQGDKGSEELLHLGRDVCETYSQDSWKMVDACKGLPCPPFRELIFGFRILGIV